MQNSINDISDPNAIYIGQELKIPPESTPTPTVVPGKGTPTPRRSVPTLVIGPTVPPPPTGTIQASYRLADAVMQGLVTPPEIRPRVGSAGTIVSSGDAVIITLTRRVPQAIEITIPRATVLIGPTGIQNMVVRRVRGIPINPTTFTPTAKMQLLSDQPADFLIEAYSINFYKANATESTRFAIGQLADPKVQEILAAADAIAANQISQNAIQIAIWAVTDNVAQDELFLRFPSATPDDVERAKTILVRAGIDMGSLKLFPSP
jgi:hypothetical protein